MYKYRSDNKLTQKHFINRPNILTVAKTRKNVLVAAYTTQKFEPSRPKVIEDVPIKALLMNFDLENRQHMAFPLHYGRDSVDYGSDRICYGNSELRIEAGSTKMMCNVGYKGHAFDTGNKAVKEFLK